MTIERRDYVREARDNAERKYAYDFDQVIRRYVHKTFAPNLHGGRAIEIGCFRGDFTALLKNHFDSYTVLDASSELIECVRERFGNEIGYVNEAIEAANLDAKFDAAFLLHTLEHFDDRVGALCTIGGLLAPGGRIFVAVPNAHAPSRLIAVKMGLIDAPTAVTEGERQQGHRVTYTLDALEADARAAGLTIHERGGVLFKPLANFQFDRLAGTDIISEAYLDGCYELGKEYPDLCASIYVICGRE